MEPNDSLAVLLSVCPLSPTQSHADADLKTPSRWQRTLDGHGSHLAGNTASDFHKLDKNVDNKRNRKWDGKGQRILVYACVLQSPVISKLIFLHWTLCVHMHVCVCLGGGGGWK